ncbi:MAG: hypothetical protein ACKOUR_06170 [Planctomycetota bacterium]
MTGWFGTAHWIRNGPLKKLFGGRNPRLHSVLKGVTFMSPLDPQKARILEITGDENQVTFAEAREKFFTHLKRCLEFPCLVTGIEDFRWEERYVIGNGDREE